MKVKFYATFSDEYCVEYDIIELSNDITDEEIEKEFKEWIWDMLDSYWEKVEEER